LIPSIQYSQDLRLETQRPHSPRNLVYDAETLELTWTAPIRGPRYTHFNVRLDNDNGPTSYRLPAGTTRLLIPRAARVTLSTWNDIVRTESDSVRIQVGSISAWENAAQSVFGMMLCYQVEYRMADIGSSVTITSPVTAAPNRRLLVYVFQDPTTEHGVAFDPASFVDSASVFIDSGMAGVREYAGRADFKWYPIGLWLNFDPTV
jgi:hypothetical protein